MARRPLYLESVRIDGFRSCEGTIFSPHRELSVLIGPNGAGKTNILQGMALLAAWLAPGAADALGVQGHSEEDARVTAAFALESETLTLRSTVRFDDRENGTRAVVALKDEWQARSLPKTSARGWIDVPFTFLAADGRKSRPRALRGGPLDQEMSAAFVKFVGPRAAALTAITAFRRGIRYYSASEFTDPSQYPTGLEINQDGALVGPAAAGRAHRQFLFDLYQLQSKDSARAAAYLDLVGPKGLGLLSSLRWKSVALSSSGVDTGPQGPRSGKRRERTLVIPTVHRGTDRLSFNQLSEGTLRALALVLYLLADDTDLLLLEEPEVGIHRGLLVSLLELIRSESQRKQILISTHSESVLDAVEPENVFAVKRNARGKTEVQALTKHIELAVVRDYLSKEGSLGEYWRTFGLES